MDRTELSALTVDPRKLRAAREAAGLSQEEMGKLLGTGNAQVSNIESGYSQIRANHLAVWCRACGIENPFDLYSVGLNPRTPCAA